MTFKNVCVCVLAYVISAVAGISLALVILREVNPDFVHSFLRAIGL